LDEKQIADLQIRFGRNTIKKEQSAFTEILREIVTEPMFILLAIACSIYFILGQVDEGSMMGIAIAIVTAISVYQGARSSKALNALKELTEPNVVVVRSGREKIIPTVELVPGDLMILEEGQRIPADAIIIQQNDLTVNESIITGESLPVEKFESGGRNVLYHGTLINSGKCYATVTAIGKSTLLGKIGKSVEEYSLAKTPLQQNMNVFVKRLALFGIIAFVLIWAINFLKTDNLLGSLLIGLTLAMAAIPEEIPVAFSSFMALGAYRMSKLGIISRQPRVIENLGGINVICLDKTGTITENIMDVKSVYNFSENELLDLDATFKPTYCSLLWHVVLASEVQPFDEMEKGIWRAYEKFCASMKKEKVRMVHEYLLSGTPPMMTHVYEQDGNLIVAAKGAPERIAQVCKLTDEASSKLMAIVRNMASKGQRVIGVATAVHEGALPEKQEDFHWVFDGLISLYDPPKKNTREILGQFKKAGIDVKLVTGDFPETAMNISEQVGIHTWNKYLLGETVMRMSDEELKNSVREYSVFARMFPEAKQKLIEAIKAHGSTVAMTGDGVNDAPALKSADVGIAMGKRGTHIARQAADIILTDDDLARVVDAIRHGRRIFSNLKKAVRYIISIHIPIILTASLPLLFGWKFPNIFTPVHVIFLELIMGPTCSIFFENEPEERNIMSIPPRTRNSRLFEQNELLISVSQGLLITAGVLSLYFIYMNSGRTIEETRTMVFTALVISNIFLTFTNRSFSENFLSTIKYKNKLAPVVLITSIIFLLLIHLIPPVRNIFGLASLSFNELLVCMGTSFISVMWFELYKTDFKGFLRHASREV
jgi:Ca2+-transporting ATPase